MYCGTFRSYPCFSQVASRKLVQSRPRAAAFCAPEAVRLGIAGVVPFGLAIPDPLVVSVVHPRYSARLMAAPLFVSGSHDVVAATVVSRPILRGKRSPT